MDRSSFDTTSPGISPQIGSIHPLTEFREFVRDMFSKLGFEEVYAPHLEEDEYNFGLLNIPPDHPSRDLWDTLYLEDGREYDQGVWIRLSSGGQTLALFLKASSCPEFVRRLAEQYLPVWFVAFCLDGSN